MIETTLDQFPNDPTKLRESNLPLSLLIECYRGESGGKTIERILAAHDEGIARFEVLRIATLVGYYDPSDFRSRPKRLSTYLATFCLNDRLRNYVLTHSRMTRDRDMTTWHEKIQNFPTEGVEVDVWVEDDEGIIKLHKKGA